MITNAIYFKGSAKDVDAKIADLITGGYAIHNVVAVSVSQFLILVSI